MMKRPILAAITLLTAITLQAQKRVNNRLYNPDPAPVVSGDRLYVFTGHDLDTATYFRMPDWQVFSTTDMEHWTDHGIVLTTANFKWAKQGDNAWAYSTAKSIHGPWHYEGRITDESPGSFTIHGGTIDFKGKSYLFYHDGIPSGGNGFRRTTAFREFQRMKDGRIPKINIEAK
jgi:hypothetical protein